MRKEMGAKVEMQNFLKIIIRLFVRSTFKKFFLNKTKRSTFDSTYGAFLLFIPFDDFLRRLVHFSTLLRIHASFFLQC